MIYGKYAVTAGDDRLGAAEGPFAAHAGTSRIETMATSFSSGTTSGDQGHTPPVVCTESSGGDGGLGTVGYGTCIDATAFEESTPVYDCSRSTEENYRANHKVFTER